MIIHSIAGILMGLGVGAFCRFIDVPSPSPPAPIGALIVMGMTVGYILVDRVMVRPAVHTENCGGPSGEPAGAQMDARIPGKVIPKDGKAP